MGKRKERSYALPAAGAAGLAVPALALHGLDTTLNRAGLSRDYKISKDALKAVSDFVNLRPTNSLDAASYFPEYVARARAASGAKIFGNVSDLTAAEALTDSPVTDAVKNLKGRFKFLDRFGTAGSALRGILTGAGFKSFTDQYIDAEKDIAKAVAEGNSEAATRARVNRALASHIPGTSGSYEDAYLRLLDETSGVSIDRKGHPIFSASRRKGGQMAEDLYEAVVNHTRPTREGFQGAKSFGSASEYLDSLWGNTKLEGTLHGVPGAYRNSTDIAAKIINEATSKEQAIAALTEQLGGNKSLYSTLRQRLGSSDSYGLVDVDGEKVLKRLEGTGNKLGKITSHADATRAGLNDLATSIFHGDATRMFSGAAAGHTGDLNKAKIFNILQKVRNPYLRAAFGLGSVGGVGLLANNIIKNRQDRKNRWIPDWLKW